LDNQQNTHTDLNTYDVSITLGSSLDDNVQQFRTLFQGDDTFIVRFLSNQQCPEARFCILYIEGMLKDEVINESVIQPLIQTVLPRKTEGGIDHILQEVILSNQAEKVSDGNRLLQGILRGECALLMDNCSEGLVINAIGWQNRGIQEPVNEQVLRGPREGFVESIIVNQTMIRRRLATPKLKFVSRLLGKHSKTKVYVCYLEGVANHQILSEVFRRLDKIDVDGVMDAGNISEYIKDAPYSPFETTGITERPDVAAADLLEGRIIILIDGTPVAITLPFLFEEYFQTDDDYYINYYFASFNRLLRMVSFILTITAPGVYVALLTYHHELIPSPLLFSISAAREGVPFPTVVETIFLLFIFEIMREVGMRVPMTVGQTISILGALVLGTAAVDARIVSAPVIIVVAITGLTGLITPRIKAPVIILRLMLVLMGGFMGLFGVFFGIIALFQHLCGLRSFGVPYMIEFSSLNPSDIKDTFIRAPHWFMKKRPTFISGRNRTRQGNWKGGT